MQQTCGKIPWVRHKQSLLHFTFCIFLKQERPWSKDGLVKLESQLPTIGWQCGSAWPSLENHRGLSPDFRGWCYSHACCKIEGWKCIMNVYTHTHTRALAYTVIHKSFTRPVSTDAVFQLSSCCSSCLATCRLAKQTLLLRPFCVNVCKPGGGGATSLFIFRIILVHCFFFQSYQSAC